MISPGSRSTPLALACQNIKSLRCWVQPDERSAAFFALGLAKATGAPTLLVGTSGTAPAHWYPAVIEAAASHIPLILLSADRPPELWDCGANQTIDQTRLFGDHVRAFTALPPPDAHTLAALPNLAARTVDQALWPTPGPVQVNMPFREPLVPSEANPPPLPPTTPPRLDRPTAMAGLSVYEPIQAISGGAGIITCGARPLSAESAKALTQLAEALGAPVLADPLSGLRFTSYGRNRPLVRYDAWLRSWNPKPDWILSFGGPLVSKAFQRWLEGVQVGEFVIVDSTGSWPDPARRATRIVRAETAAFCKSLATLPAAPKSWLEQFYKAEALAEKILDQATLPEAALIRALVQSLPEGATLFAGNSLPIRDIDLFCGSGSKRLEIVANRGVSGIDGNISTVLGMAAAGREPVAALIGDVAFFHDLNGLLLAREGLEATIVVVNNGGGRIFEQLPQAKLDGFKRFWLTPTGIDIGKAAALFGCGYRRINKVNDIESALSKITKPSGVNLLELPISEQAGVESRRQLAAALTK